MVDKGLGPLLAGARLEVGCQMLGFLSGDRRREGEARRPRHLEEQAERLFIAGLAAPYEDQIHVGSRFDCRLSLKVHRLTGKSSPGSRAGSPLFTPSLCG